MIRDIVFDVAVTLGYEMTDTLHLAMVGSSHEETSRLLIESYGASFPYELFDGKCREMMHERLNRVRMAVLPERLRGRRPDPDVGIFE